MEKPRSIFLFTLVLTITAAVMLSCSGCARRQIPEADVKLFKAQCEKLNGLFIGTYNEDLTANSMQCIRT